MKSNYKKLGTYIREVVEKNTDLGIEKLLGVSITKQFIPSIANTVGTDMSKYKIVRTKQFAYGPVTSRNGDRISVALLQEDDCIISTSYTVFEIINHEELDPEYLMMWLRRAEFDRYARFISHGSVRELFGWEEMCDVELPISCIEKQREIVREYNTIVDRINLNEQLNQKLEQTASALFKQWFVDFEFPISKEYAESVGRPELYGKPYKSSGGEVYYDENIGIEIPKDWSAGELSEITETIFSGGTPNTEEEGYWGDEHYWLSSGETREKIIVDSERMITQLGVENSSTKLAKSGDSVMATAGQGKTRGQTSMCRINAYINQSMLCIRPKNRIFEAFIFIYLSAHYHELRNESDAQAIRGSLNKDNLSELSIVIASNNIYQKFQDLCSVMIDKMYLNRCLTKSLEQLRTVLLAKISRVN